MKRLSPNQCLNEMPPAKIIKSNNNEFNLLEHCLFCGKVCIPKDRKNPKHWRKCNHFKNDKKQFLQNICLEREDQIAEEVYIRLQNTTLDLPDLGAQYHCDCYVDFTDKK